MVVLTAFSQTQVLGSALAMDVNGFLVKPITPAMVDEKLAKAMSEKFRVRPPPAYEVVMTDLGSLPRPDVRPSGSRRGASIPLPPPRRPEAAGIPGESRISLQQLRPGLVLLENVYLPDGTLLLSSGHVFSELSINRLYDLRSLLKEHTVCAQEPSAAGG